MTIKAVIFDIGGVCVGSPLHAINQYEKDLGLPHNFLNFMIARWKSPTPLNRLESGDIASIDEDFYKLFGDHLSDPKGHEFFLTTPFAKRSTESQRSKLKEHPKIDGFKLFTKMAEAASKPNDRLIEVIRSLKASGDYQVWALTNNFPTAMPIDNLIHPLFHRVIGSVQMKMRKPDPRIYAYVIDELSKHGITPQETVFLDDIGANLKAARDVGINTIQVDFRTTPEAIEKLQAMLSRSSKL